MIPEAERRIATWTPEPAAAVLYDPTLELRQTDGKLTGYAIVYGSLSRDLGGFVERIKPGAVELASDVLATFNHSLDHLLGRTASGTLELVQDERGLLYKIDLPDTQSGRDVRELVRRGDVRGSSFTFRTLDQGWSKLGATALRTVNKMRVTEVGPVTLPAYPDTTAAMRSLDVFLRSERAAGETPLLDAARRREKILALYQRAGGEG